MKTLSDIVLSTAIRNDWKFTVVKVTRRNQLIWLGNVLNVENHLPYMHVLKMVVPHHQQKEILPYALDVVQYMNCVVINGNYYLPKNLINFPMMSNDQ